MISPVSATGKATPSGRMMPIGTKITAATMITHPRAHVCPVKHPPDQTDRNHHQRGPGQQRPLGVSGGDLRRWPGGSPVAEERPGEGSEGGAGRAYARDPPRCPLGATEMDGDRPQSEANRDYHAL